MLSRSLPASFSLSRSTAALAVLSLDSRSVATLHYCNWRDAVDQGGIDRVGCFTGKRNPRRGRLHRADAATQRLAESRHSRTRWESFGSQWRVWAVRALAETHSTWCTGYPRACCQSQCSSCGMENERAKMERPLGTHMHMFPGHACVRGHATSILSKGGNLYTSI